MIGPDYYKNWERAHPQRHRPAQLKRAMLFAVLKLNFGGCVDCGYNKASEALDFDHLDGTTKHRAGVGQMSSTASWGRILEEISKCELVCANCHRIRTQRRKRHEGV